jgi:hypothetical protein
METNDNLHLQSRSVSQCWTDRPVIFSSGSFWRSAEMRWGATVLPHRQSAAPVWECIGRKTEWSPSALITVLQPVISIVARTFINYLIRVRLSVAVPLTVACPALSQKHSQCTAVSACTACNKLADDLRTNSTNRCTVRSLQCAATCCGTTAGLRELTPVGLFFYRSHSVVLFY